MKLSVCIITYNHEKYIRQALESVLAQETPFAFEVVIGEDCSTDNTRRILEDMAQRHPGRLKLLLRGKNLGMHANARETLAECTGEYVALLEGDDYWTDARKLQTQVAFLDAHPDYSMCFHRATMFWDDASREPADVPAAGSKEIWTVEDFLAGNPVLTASVVIRGDVVRQRPAWIEEIPCGDWPTWIQAACQGRVRFIDRKMSEYRIHVNGSWSSMTNGSRLLGTLQLYQRLREHLAPSYQQQIAQRVAALHWELSRDLEAAGNRERAKTHVVKAVEALLECAPKGESLTEAIPRGLDRIRGKTARDGTFASITGELKALGAPWFRLGECWRNFREYCRLRQEFHDFRRAREGPDMSAVSAGEASVTDDEFCLLRELVVESGAHPGPIVEIGTLLGYTTSRMAVWKAPAKRIITVDNYLWDRWGFTPKTHFELTSLVLFYLTGTGNVQQCRADKNEWFRQYAGEAPSLVFCDAIHTYEETKRDIGWARGAGARLISGHDYSPEFPGVVQAVNEAGGPERLRGTVWCLPASK